MKLTADKKRTDCQFAVGDQVLLKLQPYTQSSVANRPYPKLAYKYFGPYTVIQKVGTVAYRLQLPDDAQIHDVFHVSQLKPYTPDYTPIYDSLPILSYLEAAKATPLEIMEHRVVKKGNTAVPQVKLRWTGLPPSSTTWEDYYIVKHRFPDAPAWGQAASRAGGGVTPGPAPEGVTQE